MVKGTVKGTATKQQCIFYSGTDTSGSFFCLKTTDGHHASLETILTYPLYKSRTTDVDGYHISYVEGKTHTSSSVVGDPYIVPLDGSEVWKMPNFEGYSRMLQGTLNDKKLTINVKTTISSPEEAKENKDYSRAMLKTLNLDLEELEKEGLIFDDMGEAFMRQLWVKYGDSETIIDMEKLTQTNNIDFKSSKTTEFAAFDKYDCHHADSIKIPIENNLSLIISKYPNPQVRTGFKLEGNIKQIENTTGVLCNKMYKNDMKLKRFTSTKPLTQTKNRQPRSVKYEQYWNSDGKEETMKLDVY